MDARSTDTAESLLALPARELYGRLALWLLDADEGGMADFRQRYLQQGRQDFEITRLIFVNWTRLNPQGANHAATSDEDLYHVWDAWASHDPAAALTADAALEGKMTGTICSAIGEFHPSWLLAHFDRIPERSRDAAVSSLRNRIPKYPVTERTLQLAAKWQNPELTYALLSLFTSTDPFQAWLWKQAQNPNSNVYNYDELDSFMRNVNASQTGDLERISATLPPGELKRELDAKTMELLARVDPEGALAKARAAEVPRIKAQLLAIAAKSFIYSDPKKALGIADEIFAACPGLFDPPKIELPGGSDAPSQGDNLVRVYHILAGVSSRDPVAVMQSFLAHDPNLQAEKTLAALSGAWVHQAPESYANWLNTQTDPRIRVPGARVLVDRLAEQEQYPEALAWAASLGDANNPTDSVFRKWRRFDPEAALAWLDAAKLPDDRKTQLRAGGKP